MFSSQGSQVLPAGRQVTGLSSVYIHIPFCKKKCNYCDFVSYVGQEGLIDAYVNRLCREIKEANLEAKLHTIYFGGGTPTLLEPEHFEKVLDHLRPLFSHDVEISIEANPGTADLAKLRALRDLGINRLSIGVQSFNDQHLQTLGRIHAAAQALNFYRQARQARLENINLDLIFALPGQTLAEWEEDLALAIQLKPEHLSVYNLIIEEGTPLFKKMNGAPPNNDLEADMYEWTIQFLKENGYQHYEISNFARPGQECRHNLNYWRMGEWLGFGAGAHSQVGGWRWENPPLLKEYLAGIKPPERIATTQSEKIMMGLRLLEGIPLDNFTIFKNELNELITEGWLEQEQGKIRFTRKGLLLGNRALEKFI